MSIIFVSGPTAIGKSELALKLAEKINGEIINADSMQVYKELKILTARPSTEDQNKIIHHLYGHISGTIRYNVAEWCSSTSLILERNLKKNKISIIVGGTGLYIDSLVNGISNIPKTKEEYKYRSNKLLLEIGLDEFYKKVFKIDKISCENISKNDTQRLKRIWEVYYSTGKPLSYWNEYSNKPFLKNFDYKVLLYIPEREKIYEKVNSRFISMINKGAIDEVKKLLSLNLNPTLPIMKAHGVPEISKYLSGLTNLEECILKGQQVTRNYVKRQITWWKSSKLNNIYIYEQFPSYFDVNSFDLLKNIN